MAKLPARPGLSAPSGPPDLPARSGPPFMAGLAHLAFLALVVSLLLALSPGVVGAASQIAPRDSLWLSLPPDNVKCVVVRLPQDAGLTKPGNYIFALNVEPEPRESWSDLSGQLVREISENNTADIPICFDTYGNKPIGNCSEPYTIFLHEEYSETYMEWHGGICVSAYADVDTVRPSEIPASGEDVKEILNDNTNMIAAWFEREEQHARPGDTVVFNLSVQSHASFDINILVQSTLRLSPESASVRTSPEEPYHYRAFEVRAPGQAGSYTINVRLSPETCQGKSYCTTFVTGTLVVSHEPPAREGLEISLNPENIDIKKPEEVAMRLTLVNNNNASKSIKTTLSVEPDDAVRDYYEETINIGPYDSKTKVFLLRPGTSSRLYEITAKATLGNLTYSDTSFITIDEMVADAYRMAEGLEPEAHSDVTSWRNSHAASEYGSDLSEYDNLRDTLAAAGPGNGEPLNVSGNGDENGQENPFWFAIFLVPAALVIAVLVLVWFLKSRSRREAQKVQYY